MATRASVIFKENGKAIGAMYKHYDGYIKGGLGDDLISLISNGKVGNGISGSPKLGEYFNGAGCVFATAIAKLKQSVGDVYICDIESVSNQGEDYIYTIDVIGNKIKLSVKHYDGPEKILIDLAN
jgi:hypothetical protein